ncbi:hypothetical protein BJ973_001197 [Actinoplanes tereljensis]|uniref:Uncharacterized protein n=1 Tax=Paractinoplanes tereljensis TaxID=571912 RepID=A0A919NN89_9ACTN|nr:hypothetical protein [Actinoplanes tereljensis]GIF20897.1 hypothetical protein Ate02nite_36270 [Actinoplanes tereljensis]
MGRIDLVVPAHLVAGLRIPALAITTGQPDNAWVDVPISGWAFLRRPAQRLPLDPRSARRARRYVQLAPWRLPISLVIFLVLAVVDDRSGHTISDAAMVAVFVPIGVLSRPSLGGQLPPQTPSRDQHGNLRIPNLPITVAQQWMNLNPGVTTTDKPTPRPYARSFYASWSAGLILAAVTLGLALANDGRENFILLWSAVPVLFVAGCAAALKMIPPGYIHLERGNDQDRRQP